MIEAKEMDKNLRKEGKFSYLEIGKEDGEVLMLLHGLFGALSNFEHVINKFSPDYKILIPVLPIFELPLREVSVENLVNHVTEFVEWKDLGEIHIMGNSLGGHLTLLYALKCPEHVASLTLTGSSGLFENAMGNTYPKRGNYEFIKEKTESTFYNPKIATKELVDEVYDAVNNRDKALRIIMTAKSAIRHNLRDELHKIIAPTLLVWGKQDQITPAFVGEEFNKLIKNSELLIIDECGHAPMMECPHPFNDALFQFLSKVTIS